MRRLPYGGWLRHDVGMRFAMTGATGFLGLEIARQLREQGHEVVALVRNPDKAAALRDQGVELVRGDLDDAAALDRLLEGADGFFHVAGWFKHGRRHREALRHANVVGTRNALEAAQRAAVRTVYTSTVAIHSDTHGELVDESHRFVGSHLSEYDRTKHEAHLVAEQYAEGGLPLVTVQPSVIYGPGPDHSTLAGLMRRIMDRKPVAGPKDSGVCWVHVADAARGHLLAMEKGADGECYHLAGPPATYEEALRLLARLSGGRAPIFLPVSVVRAAGNVNGALERVMPMPPDQTRDALMSATATYYASAAKAERELGWRARPLEEGFAELVAAHRAARG